MMAHRFSQQRKGSDNPQSWQDDSIAEFGSRSHAWNSSSWLTEILTTTHSLLIHCSIGEYRIHSLIERRHEHPAGRNETQHKDMIA